MDELFVDNYMLKYLVENYGLLSYDVVTGLVSNKQLKSDKFSVNMSILFAKKRNRKMY